VKSYSATSNGEIGRRWRFEAATKHCLSAFEEVNAIFSLALALLFAGSLVSAADAAELQVYCPPLVRDGLDKLAVTFTAQTGTHVTVHSEVMGKLAADVRTGNPDVVLLPLDLMDALEKDGGVKPGSRVSLARVEIALAVRAGARHPDISTVQKTRTALAEAKALVYSEPGPPRNSMEAGIISALLKRPEFAAVHGVPVPQANGSGVMALVRGDGDMTLQVIPEILPHREVELVGPLPAELGAHIDTAAAVSSRSTNPDEAAAFLRYVMRPEATATWREAGINRF
jgi:molybdate transport system substrate-binding protein